MKGAALFVCLLASLLVADHVRSERGNPSTNKVRAFILYENVLLIYILKYCKSVLVDRILKCPCFHQVYYLTQMKLKSLQSVTCLLMLAG